MTRCRCDDGGVNLIGVEVNIGNESTSILIQVEAVTYSPKGAVEVFLMFDTLRTHARIAVKAGAD
jgi:hypothetical protein